MEIPELINKLNDDVLQLVGTNTFFNNLDQDAVKSRWLGYLPASIQTIKQKEYQLKTELPKSYREFFLYSNGFRHISPFIDNLYPIEEIDWAKNIEDESWLNGIESDRIEISDAEYLNYSKTQRSELFRPEYFRASLKISDWGDGCCLFLNPEIKHGGEWEVLFYATWGPGTMRYRSFKEYLIETHANNLSFLNSDNKNSS